MTIHPMSRIFSTPFTENILKEEAPKKGHHPKTQYVQ